MHRGELFKLRLADGDDIVVIQNCSVKHSANRKMESLPIGDGSNSSEDDTLNEYKAQSKRLSSSAAINNDADSKKSKLARPPSAFCLFFRDYEKALKANRPNVTMAELQQLAMQYWEAMDANAKQRYIDENVRLKREYDKSLAAMESNIIRSTISTKPCRGFNCSKQAVENKAWDRDFCSSQCVVTFCRQVFTTWVEENKKRPRP